MGWWRIMEKTCHQIRGNFLNFILKIFPNCLRKISPHFIKLSKILQNSVREISIILFQKKISLFVNRIKKNFVSVNYIDIELPKRLSHREFLVKVFKN